VLESVLGPRTEDMGIQMTIWGFVGSQGLMDIGKPREPNFSEIFLRCIVLRSKGPCPPGDPCDIITTPLWPMCNTTILRGHMHIFEYNDMLMLPFGYITRCLCYRLVI